MVFDRETWQLLIEYIEYGMDRADAARAVGITEKTFYDWVRKGRDEPDRYPDHAEFVEHLEMADARFEAYHAGNIYRAGAQDWKASGHALERRRPKRWAKRAVIDTTWEERLAQLGKNPQQIMQMVLALIATGKSFEEIMDALEVDDGGNPFGPDDGAGDGPPSQPEPEDMDPPGRSSD